MKLEFKDVINKEKGKNAIAFGLGPSLTAHINKIKQLKDDGFVIIGCNHIDRYTDLAPYVDYWCFANQSMPIPLMHKILNESNAIVVYADSADLTPKDKVDELLTVDYLPFDQRHFNSKPEGPDAWKGEPGMHWVDEGSEGEDLGEVSQHMPGEKKVLQFNDCCRHIIQGRLTIQEEYKKYTGHHEHCPNVYTVATNMLMLAVLLGCKDIYITGVDLDYSKGYVNENKSNPKHHIITLRDRALMLRGMVSVSDAAENIGTNIYCIDHNLPIYKSLKHSRLPRI